MEFVVAALVAVTSMALHTLCTTQQRQSGGREQDDRKQPGRDQRGARGGVDHPKLEPDRRGGRDERQRRCLQQAGHRGGAGPDQRPVEQRRKPRPRRRRGSLPAPAPRRSPRTPRAGPSRRARGSAPWCPGGAADQHGCASSVPRRAPRSSRPPAPSRARWGRRRSPPRSRARPPAREHAGTTRARTARRRPPRRRSEVH